jgi:CheY-like chemotaxis protein
MVRILLADDDKATLDFVRRTLEQDGHSVIAASDGSEALEHLEQGGGPDVLISDVEMPGLDGISLAERALRLKPQVRIILMSGIADELTRARAISSSQFTVLSKPFTLEQIRAAVRALIT